MLCNIIAISCQLPLQLMHEGLRAIVMFQSIPSLTILPPPPPCCLLRRLFFDTSAFLKRHLCLTLKKDGQPAKRLPENIRLTESQLNLAARNSSSEYISQTTQNSGEILNQLDSQRISFFISKYIFGKSFADVHKKSQLVVED